jgi:FKBP-type peptidyl-prolyl cis-trans isomerase FkpA
LAEAAQRAVEDATELSRGIARVRAAGGRQRGKALDVSLPGAASHSAILTLSRLFWMGLDLSRGDRMKRIMLAGLAIFALGVAPAVPANAQTGKPDTTTGQATVPARAGKSAAAGATSAGKKAPSTTAARSAGPAKATSAPETTLTEDEKAVYALGTQVGEQSLGVVKALDLGPSEMEAFKKGLVAGIDGKKSPYPFEQYRQRLSARAEGNMARDSAATKEKGTAFRAAAASEPGATQSASGLVFLSLQPGQGESPKATDVVRVNYRGTFIDGSEFDASKAGPVSFPLTGVVPCWTEGLQLMKVGEKAKLVCPPELAYGDRPRGPIAAGSTLVFEIELVGIGVDAAPPVPTAAPAN